MTRLKIGHAFTHRGRSSAATGRFRRRVAPAVIATTALISLLGMAAQPIAHAASLPWVNINDVTMPRPSAGTTPFAFTISLAHPVSNTVYVSYSTANGTARSTFDYKATSGTATFTPGHITATVTVQVNGSTLHTGNRYFYVYLNTPVNATIQHNPGTGTIVDTTLLPYLNVADSTVTQGAGTANSAQFNVSLTSPSANTVTVHYFTSDSSAVAGIDYTAKSGMLTFQGRENVFGSSIVAW